MNRTRHPTRRLRPRSLRSPGAKDVLIADAVRRGRRDRKDKPPVRREPYRRTPPGDLAKELTPEALDGELARPQERLRCQALDSEATLCA
jgi:hypothetical protein